MPNRCFLFPRHTPEDWALPVAGLLIYVCCGPGGSRLCSILHRHGYFSFTIPRTCYGLLIHERERRKFLV
jgi:hypothetical protein